MIKRGSVIQINEKVPEWCGCLMMVDEVKSFGCMASMKIPLQGVAYLRLMSDQYEYIGEAVFVPADSDD